MGYSYSYNPRTGRPVLCCDYCGAGEGKTRKYNICPYNYCPKVALCPKCKVAHPELFTKETHKECKIIQEHWTARQLAEKNLLDSGQYVRCSALGINDGTVHVLFNNINEQTIGYYMSKNTYHAIPYMIPATPKDYAAIGEILEAPNEFYQTKGD